jgi:ribA/ribD-fused uncharacterized protein
MDSMSQYAGLGPRASSSMSRWRRILILLPVAVLAAATSAQPAPPSAAGAKADKWDATFPGVVHDGKVIHGFVLEYRWLSNFHPCRVAYEGLVYRSSEAAYQSAKFPPAERAVFTDLDPDAAKKLAHAKFVEDAAWTARKDRVMREVVWAKFSQNPDLGARLVGTGEKDLEETNSWGDSYWGVFQGKGTDVLGKILMETRARLAALKAASSR